MQSMGGGAKHTRLLGRMRQTDTHRHELSFDSLVWGFTPNYIHTPAQGIYFPAPNFNHLL